VNSEVCTFLYVNREDINYASFTPAKIEISHLFSLYCTDANL